MENDLYAILSLWGVTLFIGWVSQPITYIFFGQLSDRGYSVAKFFGVLCISYIAFLGATLNIFPLNRTTLNIIVCLWSGFNLGLFFFKRRQSSEFRIAHSASHIPQIVGIEAAFLLFFILWAYIRSYEPEIYSIERFMDFGFIKALFNTRTLPLEDIWFSGEVLNYYYFSHFIAYLLLSLASVPPESGFFVLVAWMFALLVICVYRAGADMLSFLAFKKERFSKSFYKVVFFCAGGLSVFSVVFAGTFYGARWILNVLYSAFFDLPKPSFWYPEPTRSIPGTITEMPIFSFLVADLHPHVWGLLNGVLILSLLIALCKKNTAAQKTDKSVLKWNNGSVWLLSFLLGIAFMTNSWDVITLGLLTVAVLSGIYYRRAKWRLLLFFLLIPVLAYIAALPWSLFFKAPLTGIGKVPEVSPIIAWLLFWSPKAGLILLFFGFLLVRAFKGRCHRKKRTDFKFTYPVPHLSVSLAVLLLFIFMELFFFKDILMKGEWFRANTVFKISMQVWLWTGILSGSMMIGLIIKSERTLSKCLAALMIVLMLLGQSVYPVRAVWQATLANKERTGLNSGLNWWQKKYPHDYAAYQYLFSVAKNLPANDTVSFAGRRIVEAEGESYTDVSRFSVFLGWPTIIGWPIHEWTWRGSYEQVGDRRTEVKEVYTGQETMKTRKILNKYNIDYIIVGEFEKKCYGNGIKHNKLRAMGKIVFENDGAVIIEVCKYKRSKNYLKTTTNETNRTNKKD